MRRLLLRPYLLCQYVSSIYMYISAWTADDYITYINLVPVPGEFFKDSEWT